jgi:hypothetical protein
MSDEEHGRLGFVGAGQRTSDRTGGWEDYHLAVRQSLALGVRRVIEVVWLAIIVPLLGGPWVLAYYLPVAAQFVAHTIGAWMGWGGIRSRRKERLQRVGMVVFGLAIVAALAVVDDVVLCWWPYRWQASLSSARGILWPTRIPALVPYCVLLRCVLIVAPWRAWVTEERYITNRQRRSVVVPTADGVAFDTTPPHAVEVPGTWNPHRNPSAPATMPTEVRAIFRLDPGNGHGSMTRIVNCPETVATLEQLRTVAGLVLLKNATLTRTQMVSKHGVFTDPAWRSFQEWMVSQDLAEKTGTHQNAAHRLTTDGRTWMTTILSGEEEQPL